MTPVIEQSFTSPGITPTHLYELFIDSAKHSAATGMPAKISRKAGGKWSAFGGMIFGTNLALTPNRMIVQAWRSSAWKKADLRQRNRGIVESVQLSLVCVGGSLCPGLAPGRITGGGAATCAASGGDPEF